MKDRHLNIALLDQALISGSNFLLALFLARELQASEFGLYVFSLTSLVLCIGFLNGMVGVPISMLGASSSEMEWKEVLSNCSLIFLLIGGFLMGLLLLLSMLLAHDPYRDNGMALRLVALIVVPYIGQEFVRRVLLTRLKVGLVFYSDLLTCGGRLAAIPLMVKWNLASHDFAIYLLGGTSLAGMVVGRLGIQYSFTQIFRCISRAWLARIWSVSKWTLADWVPFFFYGQLYIYVVTFVLGNEANGTLGACRTLIAPVMVLEMGLTGYLLPAHRKMHSERGANHSAVSLSKVFLFLTFPVVAYLVVVSFFAPAILNALFGRYSEYSYAVSLLSIGIFANYAFTPAQIFLLGAVKPRIVFHARLLTAIPTILFCYPLVKYWGFHGALYSFILSHVIMCCSMAFFTFAEVLRANAGSSNGQMLTKGLRRLVSDGRGWLTGHK